MTRDEAEMREVVRDELRDQWAANRRDMRVLAELTVWAMAVQIRESEDRTKELLMSVIDDLNAVATRVDNAAKAVEAAVAALPNDDAAVVAATATLTNVATTLENLVTTLTPAAPTFTVKVPGEAFTDYQTRVAAWNADPANASNQVTELDEATWTALP